MSQFIEMFGGGNWPQKTLGEVGSFTRGGGFQKSDFVEHGIPCIHYGQIHTKFGPFITSHITEISSDLESKTKFASKGDLVIAITSEDTEGSCKSTAWLGDYSVAVGGHAAIYKHSMNPLYMSFFFKSTLFNHAKIEYVHGTKVFEIKPDDIAKILVPCPPMSLQNQFSAIAEQADKSEFGGSKSQFIEMFGRVTEDSPCLNDVAGVYDGTHKTPAYTDNGIPFISVENINNIYCTNKYISKADYALYKYKPEFGDVFMTRIGTIGKCAVYESSEPLAYYVSLSLIKPNRNLIHSKFLKYYIESNDGIMELKKRALLKAFPMKINLGEIGKIKILLPSLEKQSSFVRIAEQADKSEFELKKSIDAIDAVIKSLINS